MRGIGSGVTERDLMRAEGVFVGHPVDRLRAGPALWTAQDDHRPARSITDAVDTGGMLDAADFVDDDVERRGHRLMHVRGIVAFDKVGRPAVAFEQLLEFVVGDTSQDRRVGDLVAIKVEDWQDGAGGGGIEELVRVPGRRQWPRLGFAVANDTGGDEVGVVEDRAERVAQRISELSPFMDRPGALGRDMARDAAGERKLFEELAKAVFVLRDVRIDLAVGPFQVDIPADRRTAMTRA